MYIDKNYEIPANIPKILLDDINEMEANYPDKEFQFDRDLEVVEAYIKNCALEGSISYDDLDQLFKRYGLR